MSYLEMAKQAEVEIAAYRAALWRWWQLATSGTEADLTEIAALYDEIIRRIDELGPALADRLRHVWAVEWFKETGYCPRCGIPGEFHR
jgi:hypothetical protein